MCLLKIFSFSFWLVFSDNWYPSSFNVLCIRNFLECLHVESLFLSSSSNTGVLLTLYFCSHFKRFIVRFKIRHKSSKCHISESSLLNCIFHELNHIFLTYTIFYFLSFFFFLERNASLIWFYVDIFWFSEWL